MLAITELSFHAVPVALSHAPALIASIAGKKSNNKEQLLALPVDACINLF